MAGRVNVKFVVILTVVLLVGAGGVIFLASQVLLKSAEDHARLAQQRQDEGDWAGAQNFWGKAVNEDRTNVSYLEAYIQAVQNKPNDTEIEYKQQHQKYQASLRQMAELKKTDLEAHQAFFDELFLYMDAGGGGAASYQNAITEVDRMLGLLYDQPDSDLTKELRRYRAIATARVAQLSPDTSVETMEQGLEDAQAAIEVRPEDIDLALSEVSLYNSLANEARIRGSRNESRELYLKGIEAARAYTQRNPDSVAGQFLLVQAEMSQALRDLENPSIQGRELYGPELTNAKRQTAASYKDRVDSLAERAASQGIEEPSVGIMSRISYVLALVDPESAEERLLPIWERVAQENPDDRRIQMAYGRFLTTLDHHEEAIAVLKPIAELENVPVSTEGVLRFSDRNYALYQMANAALEKSRDTTEGRDEWTERARTYRDQLAENIATDQPMMQFLDARLALAAGDLMKADRLFRSFNESTSRSNVEGLRLAAEVANRMGNPGLERDLLSMAVDLEPTNVGTLARLASVMITLREYEPALRTLRAARDQRPDLDAIQEQINIVEALLNADDAQDPVIRVLAQSQLAGDSGSRDRAEAIIREGLEEHPDDLRLITAMSTYLGQREAWDEASEMVERGLAINPDHPQLKRLRNEIQVASDPEAFKKRLDESDLSEIEKQLRLYQLYLQTEEMDKAQAALDAAEAIDASDPRVVIYRFDEAIRGGDTARAREIYEANKNNDVDGADGLAMRARVELAEGDQESARRTLESAVERGASNAVTLRLLADVLLETGDTFNALERYREALAIRPDLDILKGYVAVLTRLGRTNDALQVARQHLALGERDPQFREMWLNLEGNAGDKNLAYQRRLEIAQREPDNVRNEIMLISLMLDLRRFDEARERLDAARADEDSLGLAALDARWHADRNDLESAVQVFSSFIASDANNLDDPSAYLTFGSFLIERGQVEQGLQTIRQAALMQDPERPVADAVLAQQLTQMGRYTEAIPVLQKLVDAEFQTDRAQAQLVESYIRANRPDEAQAVIDSLDEEQRSSIAMLLMRADVAQLQGREDEATRLVDQAIADYPDDALGYMKRAARLMRDQQTLPDAADDLTRAIELNPSNANAYRLRSVVYNETGEPQKAAADIVASANAAPGNIPLLIGALDKLLEMDRVSQAANLADQAIERRPADLPLVMSVGDAFVRAEEHTRAIPYYERAWQQAKTMSTARRLVAALLEQSRPNIERARQIAADPAITDENNAGTYILRAMIENEGGNTAGVRSNMGRAYEIVRDDPQRLNAWVNSARTLFETDEALIAYLRDIDRELSLSPWASIYFAQLLSGDDSTRDEAAQRLTSVIENFDDLQLKNTALKVRSMVHYNAGEYETAAADMERGLEINANDPDLLNNLAYVLVRHLNRADEGLSRARRAVELAPNLRAAHDTLGLALVKTGQPAEGARALETALSMATTDADRAPVLVHLAEARHASGNTGGAQEAAEEARRLIVTQPDLYNDELKDELEQVLELTRNQ